MTLNGKKLERNYITHNEIMQGGTLVFIKSELPNKINKMSNALTSEMYKIQ
jgi:putative alpha-1,2-mannosidase